MASTTPSVTPRLRMIRHGPSASITATYDRSAQSASLSEAGPSRLPEFSQLVDVDMDISTDGNMYGSDVQSNHREPVPRSSLTPTPRFGGGTMTSSTTPTTVTRSDKDKENPAAVLRALLSRLPSSREDEDDMETPTRTNPMPNFNDNNSGYHSEKDSDYEAETASVAHSIAQSSLKDIFAHALREPGSTPKKDRSVVNGSVNGSRVVGRMRRSSIGASEVGDTPPPVEKSILRGKKKSMSDDEIENIVRPADRLKTRPRGPQTLTKEFLRERFGSSSYSPTKQEPEADEHGQGFSLPDLNSSQTTPPVATSTPQQSLWMSLGGESKFQSNLLEQDSEMHKAIRAFGGSTTDSESDRSVSPPPTLHVQSEAEEEERDTHQTKAREPNASTAHPPNNGVATLLPPVSPKSGTDMSITMPQSGFNVHDYEDHEVNDRSLGEESMSLSLPAGHFKLQGELPQRSRSSNSMRGVSTTPMSRPDSGSLLRPISPSPDHGRPESPMPEDRERNWNKARKSLDKPSFSHSHSSPQAHTSNLSFKSAAASPSPRPDSRASTSSLQSPPHDVTSPKRERYSSFHSHTRSPSHPSISHTPLRTPPGYIRSRTTSISSNTSDDRSTGSVSPFPSLLRRPSTPDVNTEYIHVRERNWNSPHPTWSESPLPKPNEKRLSLPSPDPRARTNSLQTTPHPAHTHSHIRADSLSHTPPSNRAISPQVPRTSHLSATTTPHGTPGIGRARSPLPTSPSRASSLKAIDNTYHSHTPSVKRHLTSPLPATKKKAQVDNSSSVSTSGISTSHAGLSTKSSLARPKTTSGVSTGGKSSKIPVAHVSTPKSKIPKFSEKQVVQSPKVEKAVPVPFPIEPPAAASTNPYAWPPMEEDDDNGSVSGDYQEASIDGDVQEQEIMVKPSEEIDDLHDTDFSQSEPEPEVESEEGTPRTKIIEPPLDSQDELSEPMATSTPRHPTSRERTPPLPPANFDESVQNGVAATDDESNPPRSPSPSSSTPPRQPTPKLTKAEFVIPSPPKNLPDLPTPYSSDESDEEAVQKSMPKTPRFGSNVEATPFNGKTPKPPGGWLATPAPPPPPPPPAVQTEGEREDETNTDGPSASYDSGGIPMEVLDAFPNTPVNGPGDFTLGKTPKPPGGWLATPAPQKLEVESSGPEDNVQKSQLLTPISSLSKGSALKTPAAPGSWTATPGLARKSILKVRFDSQSPEQEDSSEQENEENRKKLKAEIVTKSEADLPPSPRSLRRSQSGIRVLDAYGREQGLNQSSPAPADATANQSAFRVLDALGREIKEEEVSKEVTVIERPEVEANGDNPPTRAELMLKLRNGLTELAHGVDELGGNEELSPIKRTRIRELVGVSRQSRSNRENLRSQSKTSIISARVERTSFISWNPKTIMILVFIQFVVFIVLYRVAVSQARSRYHYNHYDPFNPELHFLFKSNREYNTRRLGSVTSSPRFFPMNWEYWSQRLQGYTVKLWNTDNEPRRQYSTPT